MSKQEDIEYWSNKLSEARNESLVYTERWYESLELNRNDQHKLMILQSSIESYIFMLADAVAQPDDPKPTILKRIFHR